MKTNEARTLSEFYLWVKIRMLEKGLTQRELAEQMHTHHARISEAIHGKSSGMKYILPLINVLGGKEENFRDFLTELGLTEQD